MIEILKVYPYRTAKLYVKGIHGINVDSYPYLVDFPREMVKSVEDQLIGSQKDNHIIIKAKIDGFIYYLWLHDFTVRIVCEELAVIEGQSII